MDLPHCTIGQGPLKRSWAKRAAWDPKCIHLGVNTCRRRLRVFARSVHQSLERSPYASRGKLTLYTPGTSIKLKAAKYTPMFCTTGSPRVGRASHFKGKCHFHFLINWDSLNPFRKIRENSKTKHFFLTLKFNFTMNGASVKVANQSFFLSMVHVFTMQKIGLNWALVQPFLNINHDFDNICFLKKVTKKLWGKIWVITYDS